MRRVVSSVMLACGLLAASFGLVVASLIPTPAPAAAAGKKVCAITDERLIELSGMIATQNGYVVINDSSEVSSRERVFLLDRKCKVVKSVQYSGNGPRDTEDLAISPDGRTLWIADTGDNITSSDRRPSVVLWSMPVDGSAQPVLHRLTYPRGKAQDAEALLIADDGTPYVITKTLGKAEIYRPTGPLRKNNSDGVPMEKAGEIGLPTTTTANPFGPPGRITVTGAARSPDGKRVALRTYADAFEWDVPDGDLVKALTTGTPRVTALADPFGEAIAYSPDGSAFLTVSDVGSLGDDAEVAILSYVPAKQVEAAKAGTAGGAGQADAAAGPSWTDKLTLDQITYLIAGVGVLGVLLVGAGVLGIVLARRRPKGDDGMPDDDGGYGGGPQPAGGYGVPVASAAVARPPAGSGPARGRTYGTPGGQAAPPPPRSGGVYGGRAPSGGVYGGGGSAGGAGAGRPRGGGVYGGEPAGGATRDGPDRRGAAGGGYGGNGAYRPDDARARAGGRSSARGHPDEPGPRWVAGRGAVPPDPRHPDNDYGYR